MKQILVTLTKEDMRNLFTQGDELEFTGNASMYVPKLPDGTFPDCYAITDGDRAIFKVVDGLMVRIANRVHPDHFIGLRFEVAPSMVATDGVHLSIIDLTKVVELFGTYDRAWEDFTIEFDEETNVAWSTLRNGTIMHNGPDPLPAMGNA